MTFREALEREIAAQGLSVAEVARASGISKGAVYNILNGTTEESRIRPATRRAIARGCNRELQTLEDGSILFVEKVQPHPAATLDDVALFLVPGRPFLESRFLRDAFDWLHELEEKGELIGARTVDRVFQKRHDFLSLIMENRGGVELSGVQFDMNVVFAGGGPSGRFPSGVDARLAVGERIETTLFLAAGPAYCLQLQRPAFTDVDGQTKGIGGSFQFTHQGTDQ